jgi:hypothetical protein
MFVPDQIWVTANFKEIQLDRIRPGEPVTLRIDAYPERIIRGHVVSVQPGSGTAFSLLPAQNATGNYVKIVQRVPVKIVMDDPPTGVALGPTSAGVSPQIKPGPKIGLDREPPGGTLPYGKKALVDDGTCPPGQIKQIIGGDNSRGIGRSRSCIPRP